MSAVFVSVVIPVFNAERFLAEAIHSVQRQSHRPIETIVIDDGSTDRSCAVARQFADVRCYRQENRGISAARNAGVRHARGDLLAFLDADDLWTDCKLASQLAALYAHPEAQIVAGRIEQFHHGSPAGRTAADRPATGEAYTAGAMLLRPDDFLRVGMFNEELRLGEFMDWHSRAMNLGLRELHVDEVVLRRRIHDSNTTLRSPAAKRDYLAAVRAHLQRNKPAA